MVDPALHRCARSRTFLVVPGHEPERIGHALASRADALVLDLGAGVPALHKQAARDAIAQQWSRLANQGVPVMVRMNAHRGAHWTADLELLHALPGLAGLVLPQTASSHALAALWRELPRTGVLPSIENAAGLANLEEIALMPNVVRLILGPIAFLAGTALACSDDERERDPLRLAIARASRAAWLAPPVDGATACTSDELRREAHMLHGQRFGFAGKLCIHPWQVAGIHAALAPARRDRSGSQRLRQADGRSPGATVRLDERWVEPSKVRQPHRAPGLAEPLAQS